MSISQILLLILYPWKLSYYEKFLDTSHVMIRQMQTVRC